MTIILEDIFTNSEDAFQFSDAGESVTVAAGVTVSSVVGTPIWGRDHNNCEVIVNGSVVGGGRSGIDFFGTSGHRIVVGATGKVEDAAVMAIETSADCFIQNHGAISSERGFGIVSAGGGRNTVINTGTIFGETGGIEFTDMSTGGPNFIINFGTIEAGHGEDDQVFGAGSNQAVYTSFAETTILNAGTIEATDKQGSEVVFSGFDASGSVTNSGQVVSRHRWGIDISGLAEGNAVAIENTGTISGALGSILGSGGADAVTNAGRLAGRVALAGGNDHYDGRAGSVAGRVLGDAGADMLRGGALCDVFHGGAGGDRLEGNGGNDLLIGDTGGDFIFGGSGSDVLRGGIRRDRLAGNAGADMFVFTLAAEAGLGAGRDLISDFTGFQGDRIDLSSINAKAGLPGNQAFDFIESSAFAGRAGQLNYCDGVVAGDTDGDGAADFQIAITNEASLNAGSFFPLSFRNFRAPEH